MKTKPNAILILILAMILPSLAWAGSATSIATANKGSQQLKQPDTFSQMAGVKADGTPILLHLNADGSLAVSTGTQSSSTVTANAGANLNTSALALESGGNIAAILLKLNGVIATSASGASTSSNQSTEITALNQIHSDLIAPLPSGSGTIGSVLLTDGSNSPSISIAPTDGTPLNANRLRTTSFIMGYNGSTIDMLRSSISGIISSVTGHLNTLWKGQYNAGGTTLTNGQWTDPQMDSQGNLEVKVAASIPQVGIQPVVLAPPTNNLLNATGTVQYRVVPGGLYSFCLSINSAVLGVTANSLASCTTAVGSTTVTYTGAAPQVGQVLGGTGITPGAYVVSVNAGVNFVMSLPANAAGTNTLTITAGSFVALMQASTDGTTWNTVQAIPKTFTAEAAATGTAVAPGLFLYQSGPNDNYLRWNVTSINATGVTTNLTGLPSLRLDIDAFDRQGGVINLPYLSYVAATAATFPTGIPMLMPVDTSLLSELDLDLSVFAGTSQTVTWKQSNDGTGVIFQGVASTTTSVAQNAAAITAAAAGNYRIAPGAKYFLANITAGTAVTSMTIGGYVGRVGVHPSIQDVCISTNNTPFNVSQYGGQSVVTGGVNGVPSVGGNVAHSAARTANPVVMGGQTTTTLDTTLVQGDVCYDMMTSAGQKIVKSFGSAENDFNFVSPASGAITNTTTPLTIQAAPAASIHNYYTNITLNTDAMGTATELALRDVALTLTTSVISSNTLVTSANHGLAIGDAIVFTGVSGLTGPTAGPTYYVLTVPSATSFTISTTMGGSTLTVTGTPAASQTLNHYLWRTKLQTAGILTPVTYNFPTPLKGGSAVLQELLTITASTGAVYFNAQGYRSF